MENILFILKKRTSYSQGSHASTGLLNSATLLSEGLHKLGFKSIIQEVIDGNCIDKYVTKYKPHQVIIEALWVTPEKLAQLKRLHPKVKWIVRIHSEIPFISSEGIAIEWLKAYHKLGITIGFNSKRIKCDIEDSLHIKGILLPNYYDLEHNCIVRSNKKNDRKNIKIGCFGALRPLKNQLIQAHAAIAYARKHNLKLEFHINVGNTRENGNNILKNITNIFEGEKDYILVEHEWLNHENFLKLVYEMDLCLQVSFSETFNIVTADAVIQRIPVVTSTEIDWVLPLFQAKTTSLKDIVKKMELALFLGKIGTSLNIKRLKNYNKETLSNWKKLLK